MVVAQQTGLSKGKTSPSCNWKQTGQKTRKGRLICYVQKKEVTLLDYGAGNVRSVRNAVKQLGFILKEVESPKDIVSAEKLLFPGVGSFGPAMDIVKKRGYVEPLVDYLQSGKSFLGICLGLQLLFEGSEENGGVQGLGVIPGMINKFTYCGKPIPQIGWNTIQQLRESHLLSCVGPDQRLYFVHSYRAVPQKENQDWILAKSSYGEDFVAAINQGNIYATQFHPEKSGPLGLQILNSFLTGNDKERSVSGTANGADGLSKRVIACLDVRSNDQGDLVVTKGDQYDVRENQNGNNAQQGRPVRNLGKPVELAARYFNEGADELTFLNITGFRDFPLEDMPMLEVIKEASQRVFVPLTVGGGIRGFIDANGKTYSALEVASEYFRSGADKISIGGDAVYAAEEYYKNNKQKTGQTAIEQISEVYGAQAVVVSIDPKRCYVEDMSDCQYQCTQVYDEETQQQRYCYWQCTVKGGREVREIGAVELAEAVEDLGAGEILLNCIDKDGQGTGFDLDLVKAVSDAVTIPVIASSGAGEPTHFVDVFSKTNAAAALAAGIFHRKEVSIASVKQAMSNNGILTRVV